MPSIGDLVTNLICDATQYESGTQKAISENKALTGSIDSIIGQLERQKKAFENANKTTTDNILGAAGKGATEGQINVALQLQEEVEALHAEKAAKDQSRRAGEQLVASLKQQAATYGMTTAEIREYSAVQAGASDADLKTARQLEWNIGQQQRFERSIQKQITAQREARMESAGMSRGAMALTEAIRGLEDGVAGYTNNGLKGMLMATTNNIGQMGVLIGGTAGLALSIGSVAALIGVSLLPMLAKWLSGTDELIKKQTELDTEHKRVHDNIMGRMESRLKSEFQAREAGRKNAELVGDRNATAQQLDAETNRLKERERDLTNSIFVEFRKREQLKQRHVDIFNENVAESQKDSPSIQRMEAQKKEADEVLRLIQESEEAQNSFFRQSQDVRSQLAKTEAAKTKAEVRETADEAIREKRRETEEIAKLNKERAEKERKTLSDLAATTLGLIREQSQEVSDKIEKKRKEDAQRKQLNDALQRGTITQQEFALMSSQVGKSVTGVGGSAAAIQSNSTAAYSAVVQAINRTRGEDVQRQQLKKAEEMAVILDKIEKKEQVVVKTLSG